MVVVQRQGTSGDLLPCQGQAGMNPTGLCLRIKKKKEESRRESWPGVIWRFL